MPKTKIPTISSNRAVQYLLGFLFLIGLGGALFGPLLAVFITDQIIGATLATVGFAAAIASITKSIVQVPLSQYMDRCKGELDDFILMLSGSLLTTLYIFGFTLISLPSHFYALSVLGGIGTACVFAAYYGIFSRHVDGGSEGFEWSLFSVVGTTLPVAVGGAVGGIIADLYGFTTIFIIGGILGSIATILLVFLYPYLYKPEPKKS